MNTMEGIFTRPSQNDTEDDLLELQQQFLASKASPSAQVVQLGGKRKAQIGSTPGLPEDQPCSSKHAAIERDVVSLGDLPGNFGHTTASTSVPETSTGSKASTKIKETDTQGVPDDPEAALDEHDQHITNVLKEIVEKEYAFPVYGPSAPAAGGFPKVLHRGNISHASVSDGQKKKSLFAQQFANRPAQDFGLPKGYKHKKHPASFPVVPIGKNIPVAATVKERTPWDSGESVATDTGDASTSSITTGDDLDPRHSSEAQSQIHQENAARLSAMTRSQILDEQQKLLQTLDPSIVSFLKKRSKEKLTGSGQGSMPSSNDQGNNVDSTTGNQSETNMDTSLTTDELPVKPSTDWVHMDRVEGDKLAWIKDLPAPQTGDNKTGQSARFDFLGNLVGLDAEIPTHLGLHHHGEEPERAGYTLEELFHLARSAHMQQRVLAINTLAKIIHNARRGKFYECVSTPLIPALVDGGLVFILRWALDDTTDNTMAAAVACLHQLLVTTEEEDTLDHVFCWFRGHEVPCLCPTVTTEDESSDDPPQLSDAEVLKQDIIKGLVRMSLLPRLRYILEVWRPPAAVVIQILDVLIRLVRHSPEVAYQVSICPRLMDTVFKEFLPWEVPEKWVEPLTIAYGHPCSRALKLIRVMCAAGRNMAANLISHHPVMDRVVVYISQEISSVSHEEIYRLVVESYRTWKILAVYGLTLTHYSEYYSVFMRQLQKFCTLNPDDNCGKPSEQLGCTLLNFLETVTHTAANVTTEASRQVIRDRHAHNQPEEMQHRVAPAIPECNWSHVTGLYQPVQLCLQNRLEHFTKCYFHKKYSVESLTSCLNFVASWMSRAENMPGYNAVEYLSQLEQMSDSFILPVLQSAAFRDTLKQLRESSALLYTEPPGRSESVASLPELGVFVGDKATICPVLQQHSTLHFVLAFLRLLSAMKVHKGIINKVYDVLLEHDELLQYVRRSCRMKHSPMANNHFTRFEIYLQDLLLTLVKHKGSTPSSPVYHQMALYLITYMVEGEEHIVHGLLSNIVFNKDFLRDTVDDLGQSSSLLDEKLRLEESSGLSSATQRSISVKNSALVDEALCALSNIRSTYLTAFGGFQKAMEMSKNRCEEMAGIPDTLVLGRCGQTLVPLDWVFSPLIAVYNNTTSITSRSMVEESVPPATIAMVTNTLRWVFLMETCRPQTLESISFSLKLSRILCTFLAGSDLFLDAGVQCCLTGLLQIFCRPTHLDRMDFTKPIPGLSSFYDLYMMLLEQYGAVSFGDSVFGCYLLLPLQQRHSLLLRKAVWGEHAAVLRALFIPIKEVLIPIVRFLEPEESNIELLRLYYEALYRETVSPRWCPLFYLIAVHHVNRFMYTRDGKHAKLRLSMIKQMLGTSNQVLKHHVLYYKTADVDQQLGMVFYDNLPSMRQQLLDRVECDDR